MMFKYTVIRLIKVFKFKSPAPFYWVASRQTRYLWGKYIVRNRWAEYRLMDKLLRLTPDTLAYLLCITSRYVASNPE